MKQGVEKEVNEKEKRISPSQAGSCLQAAPTIGWHCWRGSFHQKEMIMIVTDIMNILTSELRLYFVT